MKGWNGESLVEMGGGRNSNSLVMVESGVSMIRVRWMGLVDDREWMQSARDWFVGGSGIG